MTIMGDTLKFSLENAKLDKRLIFNIPAGHTCPRAGVCRTTLQIKIRVRSETIL